MMKILGKVGLIMAHVREAIMASGAITAATDPTHKTQDPRWDYTLAGGDKREPS